MTVPIGKKNRYLTIERRQSDADALNQQVDDWVFVGNAWANIRGETGLGAIRNSVEGVDADTGRLSLEINYRPSIDAGMRATHHGVVYSITAVRHDHANREWTHLICTVGANDG